MDVPSEIAKLITTSGNNFHAKVARWFTENGWHIVVSPYYLDQMQNKAREIDLVAERLWPVTDDFNRRIGDVAVRLFIECKYVSSHSVFWFAEKDRESSRKLVCSTKPFRENNTSTDKHHYLSQSSRVAKLFSSANNSGSGENEPFYKALNQSLNAMVSMRGQSLTISSEKDARSRIKTILEFPIIVCNSFEKIYAVDFYADSAPVVVSENFQLEVRYAYIDRHENRRNEYFLLDFVEVDALNQLVEAIDQDAKAAAYLAA